MGTDNWSKRFDEYYPELLTEAGEVRENVKSFIQSELNRQLDEILGLKIMELELQNVRTSYKKIFRNELRNEIKETINNLKKQ